MNTIPRDLEKAFKAYLTSCATEAEGGLWLFKTASGSGTAIEIRTGQSDAGEHPERGMILCQCFGDTVQQEVPGINAWRAVMQIEFSYPHDSYASDATALAAFDFVAAEISHALTREDALNSTNQAASGAFIYGVREGLSMESGIENGMRFYRWTISLLTATNPHKPIDL